MKGIIKHRIEMRNGCYNPSKKKWTLATYCNGTEQKKKKKKNCQVIAFVKETYFMSLLGKILTYFLSTARKFLIERSKEIYQCQGKAHALTNNVTKF